MFRCPNHSFKASSDCMIFIEKRLSFQLASWHLNSFWFYQIHVCATLQQGKGQRVMIMAMQAYAWHQKTLKWLSNLLQHFSLVKNSKDTYIYGIIFFSTRGTEWHSYKKYSYLHLIHQKRSHPGRLDSCQCFKQLHTLGSKDVIHLEEVQKLLIALLSCLKTKSSSHRLRSSIKRDAH